MQTSNVTITTLRCSLRGLTQGDNGAFVLWRSSAAPELSLLCFPFIAIDFIQRSLYEPIQSHSCHDIAAPV
jgi:hypothetical protein